MTAFNVVRFRVKPGEDERYLEAFRSELQPTQSALVNVFLP